MAESDDSCTFPSTLRSASDLPESETMDQYANEEEMSHLRFCSYQSMTPRSVDEFLSQCPNAASLTPSPNSCPITPRPFPEMQSYVQKARFRQAYLSTADAKWWKWEARKQNMKARILEMEYRFIYEQGAESWDEYDWERRDAELRTIMQDFWRNREKWLNCMGCVHGCSWGSWLMRNEESRRARRFGGLVHVVLLEEKLRNVVEEIELVGAGNWSWKEMTTERRNLYFGFKDDCIDEETGSKRRRFDATEEALTDDTNRGRKESEVKLVGHLDAPEIPLPTTEDIWQDNNQRTQVFPRGEYCAYDNSAAQLVEGKLGQLGLAESVRTKDRIAVVGLRLLGRADESF